jgi:hypothetical protein
MQTEPEPDAEETLAEALQWQEANKFMGALRAIGAGVVVIVHDTDSQAAWRKTFKDAEKVGVLPFHPLIRIDEDIPKGQIMIQDVDDRPELVDEAVEQPGISDGGVILPFG